MRAFVANKPINLFGCIQIDKGEKILFDNFIITKDDIKYDSPINESGLKFIGFDFSTSETRDYKLNILGI